MKHRGKVYLQFGVVGLHFKAAVFQSRITQVNSGQGGLEVGKTLTVTNAMPIDAGNYRCTCYLLFGSKNYTNYSSTTISVARRFLCIGDGVMFSVYEMALFS